MLDAAKLSPIDMELTCSTSAQIDKQSDANAYQALNCFGDTFEKVRSKVAGKVNDQTLIFAAMDAMLSSLDAHSSYINPKPYSDMKADTRGEAGSVGVEVTMQYRNLEVTSPLDDSPAAKAGIRAGDVITDIDGEPVEGLTMERAVEKLRGPLRSTVHLTITRKGTDRPIQFSLVRDVVTTHPVKALAIDDVAYIRVTQFYQKTTDWVKDAVRQLQTQIAPDRLKGYVIDFRNDPGGPLDQAISVSDAFLERGEILSTRGRNNEETQRFNARPGDLTQGKPLIVLINGTAGSPEIVAGALQDQRRATLVGTRSFGMGSVQTMIPLGPDDGAIRLTTALFFTPSGRSIQARGIVPDIEVQQDVPDDRKRYSTNEGEAGLEKHLAALGSEEKGSQSYVPPDPKDDKALHTAIDLLRGILKTRLSRLTRKCFPGTTHLRPCRLSK